MDELRASNKEGNHRDYSDTWSSKRVEFVSYCFIVNLIVKHKLTSLGVSPESRLEVIKLRIMLNDLRPWATIGFALLAYFFYRILQSYWRLLDIPGPILARFTNLQRYYWVKTTRAHEIHKEIHDQYGDFVRLGPNMVSISDPAAIPSLYPIRPGIPKVCADT